MLPRQVYTPPPATNVAQNITVAYTDGHLTREEIWSDECESDAPRKHRRRVSTDNGRTWSAFEAIESQVNEQRPEGGLATFRCLQRSDPRSGITYRVVLRRCWPGLPLYTYNWADMSRSQFNDHVFIIENEQPDKLMTYEEGPAFDERNLFDPLFCQTNRAYPGSGIAFADDGTAYYPVVCYRPGPTCNFNAGGVRLMRRDPAGGRWSASTPQYIDPEMSSRGLLEPDVALLKGGALLVVCRGSDTPATPGRKWMCVSRDGGQTLSPVEEFRYHDGSRFYSPSSLHSFFRSTRNGRLYWLANISPTPPRANAPRYPLCIAEIDEERFAVRKETVIVVDDRREGEPDTLQLSNWSLLENRETLDWEIYLNRVGEHPQRFWETGVYRYVFSPA